MAHATTRIPSSHYQHHGHRSPSSGWLLGALALVLAAAGTYATLSAFSRDSKNEAVETLPAPVASSVSPQLPPLAVENPVEASPALVEAAPAPAEATTADNPTAAPADVTDTTAVDRSAELSPSLGGVSDIRDIDLSKLPEIAALAESTGGFVDLKGIQYADLTGDGTDEAVVAVQSGGTFGNLAYFVVTLNDGWPATLWQRNASAGSPNGFTLNVQGDALMESRGVYGPEDPLCCPSEVRKTTFAWDGARFEMQHQEVQTLPSKVK